MSVRARSVHKRMRATTLRSKLIAFVLVLVTVPLVLLGVLAYLKSSADWRSASGNLLHSEALSTIDKIDRNLFERYGDVQAFAKSEPAKSMDRRRLTAWMDTLMPIYTPIYKLMVVADTRGRIVAVNTVGPDGERLDTAKLIGRDVSGEKWFATAADGELEDGET